MKLSVTLEFCTSPSVSQLSFLNNKTCKLAYAFLYIDFFCVDLYNGKLAYAFHYIDFFCAFLCIVVMNALINN